MHIGKRIKEVLKQQGRTVTWFAQQIPCDRSNVYLIFKKESIDIKLLECISKVLQHNFFEDISKDFQQIGIKT